MQPTAGRARGQELVSTLATQQAAQDAANDLSADCRWPTLRAAVLAMVCTRPSVLTAAWARATEKRFVEHAADAAAFLRFLGPALLRGCVAP